MSRRLRFVVVAMPLAAVLTGCTLQSTAPPEALHLPAGVGGIIMGGQQPVSGSTVSLIAIGEIGYGVPAATSILTTTTTDANGNFTLPTFSCGSASTQTFIEARGGNPGLASGTNNSAIFLTAFLGSCSSLTPSTFININEVTTVATAYTLRPFISGNDVGTSSTNLAGVENAYSTYTNLVNTAAGSSPGATVPSGMSVPSSTIYSMANSLAACINSAGPTSSACSNLFSYSGVASTGSTANTFNIVVAIATNPGANGNAANIYNTSSANPPFPSGLSTAPNDWSLPVVYTSGNLKTSLTGLDIDTSGNVWVAAQELFSSSVEELSPEGTLLGTGLGNGRLGQAASLAIDLNGRIIVGNSLTAGASVVRFHGTMTDFATTNSAIQNPARLAIDGSNNILVGDVKGSMLLLSGSDGKVATVFNGGTANGSAPYDSATQVVGVAINGFNEWGVDDLYLFYPNQIGNAAETYPCGCPGNLLAFDSSGSLYVADNKQLFYLASTVPYGTAAATASFLFAGPGSITALKIDGLGKVWLGIGNGAEFNLMNLTVTGVNGKTLTYTNANYLISTTNSLSVTNLAIDRAGNVWLATAGGGGLYELVGAAAPVITPISVASQLGVATEP
jgi:hypothetical protein